MRVSVTIVRWALVWPVSVAAQRSRSSTTTRLPAFASRYAAVRPVTPPPTTTTSVSASSASLTNGGNVEDVVPVRCRVDAFVGGHEPRP